MEFKSVITYHFTEVSKQAKGGWTVLRSVVMQSGFKRTGNSTRVFFRPFVGECFLFQYRNASSRLFFRKKKPNKNHLLQNKAAIFQSTTALLRPFLAKCRSQTFEELQSPCNTKLNWKTSLNFGQHVDWGSNVPNVCSKAISFFSCGTNLCHT